MNYEVKKISTNSYHADGTTCYDYSMSFANWNEVTEDLRDRLESNNSIFFGKGFNIFRNDEFVCHSSDLICEMSYENKPLTMVRLKDVQS